jgi:hypothetical protein
MTENDFQPAAECDELLDELVHAVTTIPSAAQPAAQEPVAWADAYAISNLPAVDEAIRALLDDKTADNATAVVQAILGTTAPAPAPQPAPVPKKPALPYGWNNLTEYILQDDLHNRLTPRVVDIAYSAFMSGRTGKNKDDGGPCDWFNDTKPMVMEALAKIRKDLAENSRDNTPPAPVPLTDEQKLMCWSKATHDADVEHKTEHQCLMDYGSEIEAAHNITKGGAA